MLPQNGYNERPNTLNPIFTFPVSRPMHLIQSIACSSFTYPNILHILHAAG
jgi:hypothetical protein